MRKLQNGWTEGRTRGRYRSREFDHTKGRSRLRVKSDGWQSLISGKFDQRLMHPWSSYKVFHIRRLLQIYGIEKILFSLPGIIWKIYPLGYSFQWLRIMVTWFVAYTPRHPFSPCPSFSLIHTHIITHIDKRNKTLLCILRSKAISAIWMTYSFPDNKLTMYKTRDLFARFSPLLLAISQNIIPIHRYTITHSFAEIYTKQKAFGPIQLLCDYQESTLQKQKHTAITPKSTMSYTQPISLVYMHHGTHIFWALDLIHFHH